MSAPKFIGVNRNHALFESHGKSVIVNTKSLTASIVTDTFDTSTLKKDVEPQAVWTEIAAAAEKRENAPSHISLSESNRRTYTVPKRVVRAAEATLRNNSLDGQLVPGQLTETSRYIATLLSSGEQVTCSDVLWCSRFFENNTKETAMSHDTWMAWGGEEGRRWSENLSTRLDYDAVVADAGAYETPGVQDFVEGDESTRTFWAMLDKPLGQYANQLFKLTESGTWQAWGNGDWIECADEPKPSPRFIELDDDAALYLAGALFDAPDTPIDLRTPNPHAWDLAVTARDNIDWTLADRVLAAGLPADDYTPEERSANADGQLRDANGRFAEVGAQGAIKSSGIAGTILAADTGTKIITVKGDDGNTYEVPADDFEVGAEAHPKVDPAQAKDSVDFTGILAPTKQPPVPSARLSTDPSVLGPVEINDTIDAWSAAVNELRQEKAKDFKKLLDGEEEIAETPVVAAAGDDVPVEPAPNPTPDSSDVDPIYFAIVEKDDPQAVMDLISLVPATAVSNEPKTFRRSGGKWVEAPEVLQDLRSATPPPVIQLDADQYADVIAQVDMSGASSPAPEDTDPDIGTQTVTAAGGADRNRGNAEELRRYWTHGEGAAKIRWGTPGDFDRCVRLLSKHLGERAKGYCNLRHKDAIGIYPPTHAKNEASVEVETTDDLPQEIVDALIEVNQLPDDEFNALVAAGGADRNKGNAEELRKYWTVGAGGMKIRWNTGGDWTRCVRLLSKHLGPRAKGYCALRHREMTGMWPGDKKNREMASESLTAGGEPMFSDDYLKTYPEVLRASADFAAVEAAKMRVFGVGSVGKQPVIPNDEPEAVTPDREGKAFKIPLLIPEGLATGDGRTFGKGSLGIRSLPLPLLWQINTGEGHNGAVLVGRIDKVERTPDGLGNAYGVFDTGPYGQEAQRLVENKMLRWGSADLDKFEIDEHKSDEESGKMFIKKGRLMGWTLVPKPAFQECTIELLDNNYEENEMPIDTTSPVMASASIAQAIPVEPPTTWFERPILNGPTPITVTDEGQVFGHIATWDTDHIGHTQTSVRAPRSASGYAYFHTGVVRTAEGKDIKVGQLTLAGGHASLHADALSAQKHYDDTASAIADVHAGEDSYGIYVSGALRPGATPEQIRSLRASAPSGDWRAINHRLELVAVCQVNVPGFPVPRNMTAGGAMTSLVAAGSATLLEMQRNQHSTYDETVALSAKQRLWKAMGIDDYIASFAVSDEKREEAKKKGHALPDGSFPINTPEDLRKAIQAYGRAEESKKAKVRRHIVKRARALDKADKIPSNWKEASLSNKAIAHRDQYDAMVASAQAEKVAALRARVFPPSAEELSAQVEAARARISKK